MSNLPSRYFRELTQPEIAAQFRKNPLAILPAGSVEQHGAKYLLALNRHEGNSEHGA